VHGYPKRTPTYISTLNGSPAIKDFGNLKKEMESVLSVQILACPRSLNLLLNSWMVRMLISMMNGKLLLQLHHLQRRLLRLGEEVLGVVEPIDRGKGRIKFKLVKHRLRSSKAFSGS
jgi:hypothetical protein